MGLLNNARPSEPSYGWLWSLTVLRGTNARSKSVMLVLNQRRVAELSCDGSRTTGVSLSRDFLVLPVRGGSHNILSKV